MSGILYDEIPCVDLDDFTSGDKLRKQKFVQTLGEAYANIGFVAVKNHGLDLELTTNLYDAVKRFFALPEKTKLRYELASIGGQRGYTAKGKEHAKGRSVGDLKEFYHVGQPFPALQRRGLRLTAFRGQEISNSARANLGYPQNCFPKEVPEFATTTIAAYKTLEAAGVNLLRAIAIFLELDEFYFDDQVKFGNSILRAIHYFAIPNSEDVPEGAVRAAAHGDINLITLLMGASAEGLEILRNDGQWIAVTALPEQIVVNVGDMLERLTNCKLKSTVHRVVNPAPELLTQPRYSIPFFLHPISEMDLTCLPNCIDAEHPKQFADITAGEFLAQRLQEIGLVQ